jgi:predicted dehydrogenase
LRDTGSVAAGAAILESLAPVVHAGEDNTIRLALIGCGGRGGGAVRDALSVPGGGPIQLYAMADILPEKIEAAYQSLNDEFSDQVNVSADRKFVGFDAYKKAIDSLRPGDVAMCTTRAYIRPTHVEYAVQKGINVFMEKPFAPDPVGLQRLLRVGEEAQRKNVKIAAGLQCRHSPARQALIDRIRDGAMGDIPLIRANRFERGAPLADQGPKANQLLSQLQFGRIHLHWVGSGHMVDNLIHQIDECCWIKDSWPVSVRGLGGREPRSDDHGQNLHVYSMEFTFPDGAKAFCGFRRMNDAEGEFATFVHGTKCAAQFSGPIHAADVHLYKDQRIAKEYLVWTPEKDAYSPWQYEWNAFIASIRNDRPHNECRRAVYADIASLMGRAACHLNRTVTWNEVMSSSFQFCANVDQMDYNSPVPVQADAQGWFPVPIAGEWAEL